MYKANENTDERHRKMLKIVNKTIAEMEQIEDMGEAFDDLKSDLKVLTLYLSHNDFEHYINYSEQEISKSFMRELLKELI